MKVAIVEAMCWIDEPLSSNLLCNLFGGRYRVQNIAYHMNTLDKIGIVVRVQERAARGATEKLYRIHSSFLEE